MRSLCKKTNLHLPDIESGRHLIYKIKTSKVHFLNTNFHFVIICVATDLSDFFKLISSFLNLPSIFFRKSFFPTKLFPMSTLKGHTYLNKHAAESCRFV